MTKIDPASLTVKKLPKLRDRDPDVWQAVVKASRRMRAGVMFGFIESWTPCEISASGATREEALVALANVAASMNAIA